MLLFIDAIIGTSELSTVYITKLCMSELKNLQGHSSTMFLKFSKIHDLATKTAYQAPIEIVNLISKCQVDQILLIPIHLLNFKLPFTIVSFRICFKNNLNLQAPENVLNVLIFLTITYKLITPA